MPWLHILALLVADGIDNAPEPLSKTLELLGEIAATARPQVSPVALAGASAFLKGLQATSGGSSFRPMA
jgi:hypothetical protein